MQKPVAVFRLAGEGIAELARLLMKKVVDVTGSPGGEVLLRLADGPTLRAKSAPEITTDLAIAPQGRPIVAVRKPPLTSDSVLAISPDGRLMETGSNSGTSGYSGSALDLMFG